MLKQLSNQSKWQLNSRCELEVGVDFPTVDREYYCMTNFDRWTLILCVYRVRKGRGLIDNELDLKMALSFTIYKFHDKLLQ